MDDVRVEVSLRHLELTTKVPVVEHDLKSYELSLMAARETLRLAADKAVAALERFGRRGKSQKVTIVPSTGEVRVPVLIVKGGDLVLKERKRLAKMFRGSGGPVPGGS